MKNLCSDVTVPSVYVLRNILIKPYIYPVFIARMQKHASHDDVIKWKHFPR